MTITDLTAQRLDLAGTRAFSAPGAGGPRRRDPHRPWPGLVAGHLVAGHPDPGGRVEGVALAAVGSFARGEAGPLSDLDLVLLHDGRSLTTAEVTGLADRLWYPIWDAGARLDHSRAHRRPSAATSPAADLAAAVGLLDLDWVAGDAELVAATRATAAGRLARRRPRACRSCSSRSRSGTPGTATAAYLLEPDLKESPRRPAGRDRAAGADGVLAGRPAARRRSTGRTPGCSTSATRCTW